MYVIRMTRHKVERFMLTILNVNPARATPEKLSNYITESVQHPMSKGFHLLRCTGNVDGPTNVSSRKFLVMITSRNVHRMNPTISGVFTNMQTHTLGVFRDGC